MALICQKSVTQNAQNDTLGKVSILGTQTNRHIETIILSSNNTCSG